MYQYTTQGVCSKAINFEIEDNKVKIVSYVAGCNGNLKGITFRAADSVILIIT